MYYSTPYGACTTIQRDISFSSLLQIDCISMYAEWDFKNNALMHLHGKLWLPDGGKFSSFTLRGTLNKIQNILDSLCKS